MEACYFGTDEHQLYGVVHDDVDAASTALVVCPPFAEEMVTTYARFARWSKQLAKEGVPVVRFHPFGTGESGGSFREFTLESAVSDMTAAGELARKRLSPKRLGYFGLRLGATLAVRAACRQPVDLLVLWSPVLDMSHYLRDLFRTQLSKEMVVQGANQVKRNTKDMIAQLESAKSIDLLGFDFSLQLYKEMSEPWKFPETAPAKHVIWLARPTEEKNAKAIAERWREAGSRVDFAVWPEPAFWEEYGSSFADRFASDTLKWMKEPAESR
jgi:uncharacterized protein